MVTLPVHTPAKTEISSLYFLLNEFYLSINWILTKMSHVMVK